MQAEITRQEANSQGLTRYFTGKPCKHGHVTERMVSSGACLACAKARKADWAKQNPEKVSANRLAWIKKNPERALETKRKYESQNADRLLEMKRAWRRRNPGKIREKNAAWLAKNKERMRELNAEWYRSNKDKAKARDMRRRASLQAATVAWDSELTSLTVKEAADLSERREAITGRKWQIDHMIPIRCRKASGLHVWSNLQVIPAIMNARKLNRLILTEPGEWIHHL